MFVYELRFVASSPAADIFTFSLVEKKYQNKNRDILSFRASIFYSLQILTPFTLEPKVFIPEFWSQAIDCDEKMQLDL